MRTAPRHSQPEPHDQHRREAADRSGRHLRRRPYRGRDRGDDVRTPAVDQPPARQHHQYIGPQERGEQIAERDRRQPEFMRDRLAGDRHVDAVEIGDAAEQEQQEKDPIAAASRLIDALLRLFSRRPRQACQLAWSRRAYSTQRSDLCGFFSRTRFRLLNRALNIEGMPGQ